MLIKNLRFSEQQIALILKQGDEGVAIAEVCRKAGISEATYYNWRKKYGGLRPSEVKRLKQLKDENQRLKKMVVDLSLDKEMLQDVTAEKSKACPEEANGRCCQEELASQYSSGLPGSSGRSIDLSLSVQMDRTGPAPQTDSRDRRNACALRLSQGSCPSSS